MTTETEGAELDYHERYLAETSAGRFVIPRCEACGNTFWHPRRHCPRCGSTRIGFVEPVWPAHIYSYTVNHRPKVGDAAAESSIVGYVDLEGGVRVLATLEVPTEPNPIGLAVRPEARQHGDGIRFVFVPATDS